MRALDIPLRLPTLSRPELGRRVRAGAVYVMTELQRGARLEL